MSSYPFTPFSLRGRLILTALLLAAELLSLTIAVDLAPLTGAHGLAGLAGAYGSTALHFFIVGIVFSLAFAAVASPRLSGREFERTNFAGFTAIHLAIFGVFACCSLLLCRVTSDAARDALTLACVLSGAATVFSCALAFVRGDFWKRLWQAAPAAPWFGLAAAACSLALLRVLGQGATPWLSVTFEACRRVLQVFFPSLVCNPHTFLIGTSAFQVSIGKECSGYEGMALMLTFTSAWLLFFRREFRFPRALLMIPLGLACSWILNVARIVALILIGNAGAPEIALGGFHSVAGWIAFILLAISLAVSFQRSSWTSARSAGERALTPALVTETAAYLAPFLAILASGMLSQAVSTGFDWLYPLRVFAAAYALWRYRAILSKLAWQPGLESLAVGLLAFAIWIGWDRITGAAPVPMPHPLAAAPAYLRYGWLIFRVAGGVVTVPAAEELAFRGFVMRRLVSADFTAISFRQAGPLAILASSTLFGLLHGRMWLPGIGVGILYALAAKRTSRLADAAAAHSTTNLLLAITVLYTGDWHLW